MTLPRVSASSRLESSASLSCNSRQNSMRAATDGGVSIEPKLATCSWQILPVLPAVLNQAHCQPIGRLAKVHEHCSGTTIRARFLPSEAGPLLAASASSWRTTCHSITSYFQNGRFLSSQWFPDRATSAQTNSRAPSVVLNQIDDLWSPSTFHLARGRRSSCRTLAGLRCVQAQVRLAL